MSPSLNWSIYEGSTVTGQEFIECFYSYAAGFGFSIYDSLNLASEDLFGTTIFNSPLLGIFRSYFPGVTIDGYVYDEGMYNCTMKVYGDSSIYLRPAYYAYTYYSTQSYGNGAVNSPTNIYGTTPDGSYTQFWGGNINDGGQQIVRLTTASSGYASGDIYLYGYSRSGYSSHLYVYVSTTYYGSWQLVNSFYVTSSTPGWINVGSATNFKYMAIVGIDDQGWSCDLRLDCVHVLDEY